MFVMQNTSQLRLPTAKNITCSSGARQNWNEATKKCKELSGELVLYKDDRASILSCQNKQAGIWVGLRKTAVVRDACSKF